MNRSLGVSKKADVSRGAVLITTSEIPQIAYIGNQTFESTLAVLRLRREGSEVIAANRGGDFREIRRLVRHH
jgi:hypothetical protein